MSRLVRATRAIPGLSTPPGFRRVAGNWVPQMRAHGLARGVVRGVLVRTPKPADGGGGGGITLTGVAKSYGVVGDTIRATVTGTLPATPTVTVDGIAGDTITRISDTQVDFNIPTGTSQGLVSVTVEGSTLTTALTVAYLVEDFSTYAATSNLIADDRGIYAGVEAFCDNGCANAGAGDIILDTTVGYDTLTKSMRYDWDGYGATPAAGGTISQMLEYGSGRSEVWVEWYHRFDTGWTTESPFAGGAAYKFLHVEVSGVAGRFGVGFINDAGTINIEVPNDDFDNGVGMDGTYDITWARGESFHRYRYWVKRSATQRHVLWVDDVKVLDVTGFTTAATLSGNIALGRNINKQPQAAQSNWWGLVRVYTTDPGWL